MVLKVSNVQKAGPIFCKILGRNYLKPVGEFSGSYPISFPSSLAESAGRVMLTGEAQISKRPDQIFIPSSDGIEPAD